MTSTAPPSGSLRNSRLEALPCLALYNVLTTLDLCDIDSLARASPVLYRLVKRDRAPLIYRRLRSALGSALLDAYAAYQTSLPPFTNGIRDLPVVEPFLESYASKRRLDKAGPLLNDLSEKAIVGMWTFHTSVVEPLVGVYARVTLRHLSGLVENFRDYDYDWMPDEGGPDATLSPTERMRILRAMYRFQLYGHMFGSQGRTRPRFGEDEYVSLDDVTRLFCNLFEPWEFEELACVSYFVHHTWEAICMAFGDEIGETSPLFELVRPPGGKRLNNPSVTQHVVAGTTSRGLGPLHAVYFAGGDDAELVRVLHEVLAWPTIEYVSLGTSWSRYHLRYRKHNPTERDWKEARGDRLPFRGDGESDERQLRPPAAWVMLWAGRYSNVRWVHWDLMTWGYVMWDKDRIDAAGAGKILFDRYVEHIGFGIVDYGSSEEEEEDEFYSGQGPAAL
ncbi:hypothetical protein J3F83DRAFT_598224 [Trichoderma novae-zelandiae]